MYNRIHIKYILVSIICCFWCVTRCSILDSMDIMFVVDDCVLPDAYKHRLNSMLVSMVDKALESGSKSRTSFVFYSELPSILWNFNDKAATSRDLAVKLLTDKISSSKSKKSCLAGGVGQAYQIFKKMKKSQRTKILIVVSHQVENCGHYDHLMRISKNLTANKVFIVSVAIGKDANTQTMESIASSPKLYYHMADYSQAENMIHVVMEKLSILRGTYIPIPPIAGLGTKFYDEKFCKSFKSDLQILVDSSNYVPDDLFELLKKAVNQILANFYGNIADRRSSVTFFNAIPHQLWGLDSKESSNYEIAQQNLLNYKRPPNGGGDICISEALKHTMGELFEGNVTTNSDNKKIVLLLTTGENTCSQQNKAWLEAARLKNAGATMIVVGIGPAGVCDSLVTLASGGVNYLHIRDVVDMSKYVKEMIEKIFSQSTNGLKIMEKKNQQKRDEIYKHGPGTSKIIAQMELRYVILVNVAEIQSDHSFLIAKSAATQLIEKLRTHKIRYKIVVATFSNDATLLWNFDNPSMLNDQDAQLNHVNLLTKSSSCDVCIAAAMKSVLNDAFLTREKYKYTAKYLFLITATNQQCPGSSSNDLLEVANQYRDHDIVVLSVGVGVGINANEFKSITSEGYDYVELTDSSSTSAQMENIIRMQLKYQAMYEEKIRSIEASLTVTTQDKELVTEKITKEEEIHEDYEEKEYVPNSGFDIAIVIENSCHINAENFNTIKTATLSFIQKFYKYQYGTKFSFATYSNTFDPVYYFSYNASFKIEDATSEIMAVPLNTGCQSCLSIALKNENEILFNPGFERPNVPRIAITISYSPEQCNGVQGIRYYSSRIKITGIQMFSIALGGKTVADEVCWAGTTSEAGHYVFTSTSFLEITEIYEKIYVIITERRFDKYTPQPGDDIKPASNENFGHVTKSAVDIVVIMDVSDQTTDADFENMKKTLITMYNTLKMGMKAIKIALITVSSDATVQWLMSFGLECVDVRAMETKLTSMSITRAPQSCLYKGFQDGISRILGSTEARPDSYKLFILFGSGESNCDFEYLITTTDYTKNLPMTIATVGFGSNMNEENLIKIASSAGNFFKSEDISTLVEILNRLAEDEVEIRADKEKYVIDSNFLINQRKVKTRTVTEYVTKEVDILTKTIIDLIIVLNAEGPENDIKGQVACFIRAIYEFLKPQKEKIHIAFVVYGTKADIIWNLNSEDAINVNDALDKLNQVILPTQDEKVCVESAFKLISSDVLTSEMRKMSKKVILHITDYKSNCANGKAIFNSMKSLKLNRMLFFSIGVSTRVDRSLIKMVASDRSTEFFFTSFSELCQMAGRIGKLIKDISVTNVKTKTDVVSKNDVIYVNDVDLNYEAEETTTTPPSIETTTPTPEIKTTPSTTPEVISTTPEVISTTPEVISTTPEIVSTTPEVISTTPEVISTTPEVISTTPEIISTTPEIITPAPFIPTTPDSISVVPFIESTTPEIQTIPTNEDTTPAPNPPLPPGPVPPQPNPFMNFYSLSNKNIQKNRAGNINIKVNQAKPAASASVQHIHNINNTVQVIGKGESGGGSGSKNIFSPVFKPEIHVHENRNDKGGSVYNRPLPTHIKINFCPDTRIESVGCVSNSSGHDFPFEIGGNICQKTCNMTQEEMRYLSCNCAGEAQRRNLVSFGITNKGACYGSNKNWEQMKLVPSSYCDHNGYEPCSAKRSICIGGSNSLFAFQLALDTKDYE